MNTTFGYFTLTLFIASVVESIIPRTNFQEVVFRKKPIFLNGRTFNLGEVQFFEIAKFVTKAKSTSYPLYRSVVIVEESNTRPTPQPKSQHSICKQGILKIGPTDDIDAEIKLLTALKGVDGFAEMILYGEFPNIIPKNYSFIITSGTILPIADIFEQRSSPFSENTVLGIGKKALSQLKEIYKKGFAFKEFDKSNLCVRLMPEQKPAIQLIHFESTRLMSNHVLKSSFASHTSSTATTNRSPIVEGNGLPKYAPYNNVMALAEILREFLQKKEIAVESEDENETDNEEEPSIPWTGTNTSKLFPFLSAVLELKYGAEIDHDRLLQHFSAYDAGKQWDWDVHT